MAQERSYISMLKETAMLNTHVGSGPKDPAAKEKETKSPDEDSKGEGTQQAGTKDPNKIPALSALKKDLAKEGIQQKLLDHEKFIPFLEHIFSQIPKEEMDKHIEEKSLVQKVARNIKDFKKMQGKAKKAEKDTETKRKDKFADDLWKHYKSTR